MLLFYKIILNFSLKYNNTTSDKKRMSYPCIFWQLVKFLHHYYRTLDSKKYQLTIRH